VDGLLSIKFFTRLTLPQRPSTFLFYEDIGHNPNYTFENVEANHTISATIAIALHPGGKAQELKRVVLPVIITNAGSDYTHACYGVKFYLSAGYPATLTSLTAEYSEPDSTFSRTFTLNRQEGTGNFIGYFEPASDFTIANGTFTAYFTVYFTCSRSLRTATLDIWIGKAPEPEQSKAVARIHESFDIPAGPGPECE